MYPTRSVLAVPGDRPEFFPKALIAEPDVIMLDLEDGVPRHRQAEAFDNVQRFLRQQPELSQQKFWLRANSPDQPSIFAASFPKSQRPTFVLPKCESLVDVVRAATSTRMMCRFVPIIETPGAVAHIEALMADPLVCGMIYGHEDMRAAFGRRNLAAAYGIRHQITIAAASRHKVAIAPPALDSLAHYGFDYADGFDGAVVLTPAGVAIANGRFMPSDRDVRWAREVFKHIGDGSPKRLPNGIACGAPTFKLALEILRQAGEDGL